MGGVRGEAVWLFRGVIRTCSFEHVKGRDGEIVDCMGVHGKYVLVIEFALHFHFHFSFQNVNRTCSCPFGTRVFKPQFSHTPFHLSLGFSSVWYAKRISKTPQLSIRCRCALLKCSCFGCWGSGTVFQNTPPIPYVRFRQTKTSNSMNHEY